MVWSLLHINFNRVYGYVEDKGGRKYLALIPSDENKGETKYYKESLNKIKYLTELENCDLGNYDHKYISTRFNSDNNSP